MEVEELRSKLKKGDSLPKAEDAQAQKDVEVCRCGRKEDEQEVKLIQEELITNFQDRV